MGVVILNAFQNNLQYVRGEHFYLATYQIFKVYSKYKYNTIIEGIFKGGEKCFWLKL